MSEVENLKQLLRDITEHGIELSFVGGMEYHKCVGEAEQTAWRLIRRIEEALL